jgi:tetratricopeptide (TPR) repeat protein
VSTDPRSALRPLHRHAADVDLLRTGAPAAAPVVRLAGAVEETLRRVLRDDPTAPVEVRLRALSADDLPTDDLVAELRRRNRLTLEQAAAFHALSSAAARIAAGEDPQPGDASLALSVVEALERHVIAGASHPVMEDPLSAPAEPSVPREHAVSAERPSRRGAGLRPWLLGAVVLLAVVVLVLLVRGGGDGELRRGEAAYRAGRMAEAETAFRAHLEARPAAALPRVYLARIYRDAGRGDDAAREVQAGLASAPDEPLLHTELGFLLLDGGRPGEAAERFRTALRLDPGLARAHGGLVRALRAAGRTAEAEQALTRAPPEVRALLEGALPPGRSP